MVVALRTPPSAPRPNRLRRLVWRTLIVLAVLGAVLLAINRAHGQTGPRTLVLYDQPMGEPYQNLGKA